jgi:flavin-dependent dehydrogenase
MLNAVKEPSTAAATSTAPKTKTQRIMEKTPVEGQTGGAGGVSTWDAFVRSEQNWRRLRDAVAFDPKNPPVGTPPFKPFVTTAKDHEDYTKINGIQDSKPLQTLKDRYGASSTIQRQCFSYLDYDVVICGGTLGIFAALALQLKGRNVCVIEGGKLQGREQEWNISLDEMMELVELGVLTMDDLDESIKTEFPLCRSGFKNKEAETIGKGSYFENGIGYELDTPNVLNLGVAPKILIENVKNRFLEKGGTVMESTRIEGIVISDQLGAAIDLGPKTTPVTARLVLDCMGNASPVSRQQRYGMKPDGVCCVVGSCAGGFEAESNVRGDLIYTNSEIQNKKDEGMLQYFWEAFPVNIGRNGNEPGSSDVKTTYMFTYLDADEKRPDLLTLMEDYWKLLPLYQPSIKDPETDLDVKRVLAAFFPTYRDSPIKPAHGRLLAIGDASGIQSPLSFGGFGALTRHLERVSGAVDEALRYDLLTKEDLGEINAYTPNLSAAWMFQKAMSVRIGQNVDTKFINRLLATNFQVMDDMGLDTIKPFLQDVVRVDGLVGSLAGSFKRDPFFMPAIVSHVGIPTLVNWLGHVSMMAAYTVGHGVISPVMTPIVNNMEDKRERYLWRRRMEAWKFGSGGDYILPRDKKQ